jgi:hypothetical protein
MTHTDKKSLLMSKLIPKTTQMRLEEASIVTFLDVLGHSLESLTTILPHVHERGAVRKAIWDLGYGMVNSDSFIFRTVIESLEDLSSSTTVDEVFPNEAATDLMDNGILTVTEVVEYYDEGNIAKVGFALRQLYASELAPRNGRPGK